MSNVTVEWDQTFPVKKTSIKTTPMMSLKSIVVSSCEKFSITDPENYGLKYGKSKDLDLSLSVRFANLPAGAKLTLITKSVVGIVQNVTIALQTEEFGRLVQTFSTKTCFWSILEYFEAEKNINLTKRSGIPNQKDGIWKVLSNIGKAQLYLMPIIVFMNREYTTVDDLMKTSLEDAGFSSGNGVIRLLYKFVSTTFKETMNNIQELKQRYNLSSNGVGLHDMVSQQGKVDAKVSAKNEKEKVLFDNVLIVSYSPKTGMEIESGGVDERGPISQAFDRQKTVFKPIPDNFTMPKFDLPDAFFELSSGELKYLLSNLEHRKGKEENSGFKTKAMREREQAVKAQKYPKTCIRVRFPDKYVLQLTFFSQENVSELYDIVRESLEDGNSSFNLYVTPPMTILDPQKTFWASSLSPASVVYINLKNSSGVEKGPVLKRSHLEDATDFPILQSIISSDNTISKEVENACDSEEYRVSKALVIGEESSESSSKTENAKKLPKWLKLSKS